MYKNTEGYHALPIMEILTGEKLFDFHEKYETDGSNEIFADLSQNEEYALKSMSIRIAKTIGTK